MSYSKDIIQKYVDKGIIKDNSPILTTREKFNVLIGFVISFSILFMIVDLFLKI